MSAPSRGNGRDPRRSRLLAQAEATVTTLKVCPRPSSCASGTRSRASIGLWREHVARAGLAAAAAAVRSAGLRVSSLCRGGFFTHADPAARQAAIADTGAAIAEAAALGTSTLVLVSGGLVPGSRDIGLARRMIADAIGELVPAAQSHGVRLGIEALHPVFAADRCVITRLGEAIDLAAQFPADAVGVVVDTYHVWWDASLLADISKGREPDRRLPGAATGSSRCPPTPCSAAAASTTAASTSRPSRAAVNAARPPRATSR